jgi:hypothetical protein
MYLMTTESEKNSSVCVFVCQHKGQLIFLLFSFFNLFILLQGWR